MGLLSLINNPILLVFFVIAFLIGVTVHEFMHAWTANYLGDPTAKYAGRVTLNPVSHLDPFGTIMIVLVGFGWGKAVPINPNNFQNPRLGMALSSVAGPMSNLLVAIALGAIYQLNLFPGTLFNTFLFVVIQLNIILMLFNLIPIPPLDGSKVLALVFPGIEDPRLQTYGIFVVLGFLLLGGSRLLSQAVMFIQGLLIGA